MQLHLVLRPDWRGQEKQQEKQMSEVRHLGVSLPISAANRQDRVRTVWRKQA
jgi:hypothetical protein